MKKERTDSVLFCWQKDENLKMVDTYPPFTQTLAIGLLNLNLACLFLLNLVKGDG